MSRPIYEPSLQRTDARLGWGSNQLFRRPGKRSDIPPAAWLTVYHEDLSAATSGAAFNYGTAFETNDPDVFFWNEAAHDPGFFDNEGASTNPFLTCTRMGTFNLSLYTVVEFSEDLIVSASVPGEWILRVGVTDFGTVAAHDFHWSTNYRDLRLEANEFVGSGLGADEPPWHYSISGEIDHKIVTCGNFDVDYANPLYFFPTILAVPLLGAAFADAAITTGPTTGMFVIQWLSDNTRNCPDT